MKRKTNNRQCAAGMTTQLTKSIHSPQIDIAHIKITLHLHCGLDAAVPLCIFLQLAVYSSVPLLASANFEASPRKHPTICFLVEANPVHVCR